VTCNSVSYSLTTLVNDGITWLTTQRRNADGGFGEGGTSTALETPTDPATGPALDFLIARQRALLWSQPAGIEGLTGVARFVLAPGHAGRLLPGRSARPVQYPQGPDQRRSAGVPEVGSNGLFDKQRS